MAKILKLNGEEVLIGTDDGKIRKVSIYNIHYAPAEGDEVEIFEDESNLIIMKKEKEAIKQEEKVDKTLSIDNAARKGKSDTITTFLYITIIASIVGCFLPFYTLISDVNKVDNTPIIVVQVMALIILYRGYKVFIIAVEMIALGLFFLVSHNTFAAVSSNSNLLGAGFYITAISLVLCVIFSMVGASNRKPVDNDNSK